MPFHITCACGRLTVVPDETAGQTIRCSRCALELAVPTVDAPQPPPAPPPTTKTDEPSIVVTPAAVPRRPLGNPLLQTIYLLAAAVAAVAIVSVIPIVLALRQPLPEQSPSWIGVPVLEPWALAVILLAILHLAYVLYLLQLPDYSCMRVVALFLLLVSTSYAGVLGIRLLASNGNRIMESLGLDSNRFSADQEAAWCFLMTTLTGVLSYLAGRAASRWQRHEVT